jgi:hypothetical protein
MKKYDFFYMSLTKIVFLVNYWSETFKSSQICLNVLGEVLGK